MDNVLLVILLIVLCVGIGFAIGWCAKPETRTYTRTIRADARDMTPDERRVFDEAFAHFDAGFDAVRSLFRN